MPLLRAVYTIVGIAGTALGAAGLFYVFTPAFRLDPQPGLDVTLALIALAIGLCFLWLAWWPSRRDR
jgi:hypothetical protein